MAAVRMLRRRGQTLAAFEEKIGSGSDQEGFELLFINSTIGK